MRYLAMVILIIPAIANSNSIGVYNSGGPYYTGGG
jgi:hypothetical protein